MRNRADGSVEAVFEGDPEAVELLLRLCTDGPRFAEVMEAEVFDEAPDGLDCFGIRD